MAKKAFKDPIAKRDPGGRPPVVIDEAQLYKLAKTMLSIETIATVMGCSSSVLYDRFSDILQKAREDRKVSLAESMWSKAIDGKDTTMLIWLSKQHLGHRDKQPDEVATTSFNIYTNEIPK